MACLSSEKQVFNKKEDDDDNEKYLVVAQKLFAIPLKEVAIIVKKMNKKAAYRKTVSRFFCGLP